MISLQKTTALVLLLLAFAACGPEPKKTSPTTGISPEAPPAAEAEVAEEAETLGSLDSVHAEFAELFAAETAEVLGEGFQWAEGPVWLPEKEILLFSDVPVNIVYRWKEDLGLMVGFRPSGYTSGPPRGGEPGSNGLFLDGNGDLLLCQHGDRRIARLRDPGSFFDGQELQFETVVDQYEGKRFHSPNDLVVSSRGDIYFTDPPYGLDGGPDGPNRELDFQGVYHLDPSGDLRLVTDELSRPNGVILSSDEKTLYVSNSDPEHAVWMVFDLGDEGQAGEGRLFYDATPLVSDENPGLPDGMSVDAAGRIFATGPGGVWVFTPDGEHLGTLRLPVPAANCTIGEDGKSLFVTADMYLLRMALAGA